MAGGCLGIRLRRVAALLWRGSALALRHRLVVLAVFAATMAATVHLYLAIPKGFFPQQDTDDRGCYRAAQDISYAAMVSRVQELAKV